MPVFSKPVFGLITFGSLLSTIFPPSADLLPLYSYHLALIASVGWFLLFLFVSYQAQLKFVYSCFLKPVKKQGSNQQVRLESFYEDQAEVYDDTRGRLLRGRTTMLRLSAAQLQKNNYTQPLVWIDLGGGTGWNIEKMNEFFPIKDFHRVYLVDLTPSLCKIAEERFQRRGWSNVHVICADAGSFRLPDPENPTGEGTATLVTMSYSLSMIDAFYPVVDRVKKLLCPGGVIGVSDFYVSGRALPSAGDSQTAGLVNRQCSWFTRWFWQIWFDFDYINLHPCRRDYLEYSFETVKSFSGRNHFIVPYLVRIPYYIWIGAAKSEGKTIRRTLSNVNLSRCNSLGDVSSSLPVADAEVVSAAATSPSTAVVPALPEYLSKWRLSYDPTLKCHTQFDTYIYAFTWEDPREDLKVLNLQTDDVMFLITSAGDNVLDYLCHADVRHIHCVDMNPHQNHLLELKLAAVTSVSFEDFWKLFGEGKHDKFMTLLDDQISPHLSSPAYQFWRANTRLFSKNFFKTGGSGYALTVVSWLLRVMGLREHARALCAAETIEEQVRIWEEHLRPTLLHSWFIRALENPAFLWKACGVPINQWNMLRMEGSGLQYMEDTLDAVVHTYLLKNDLYFYLLCLLHRYTRESCPSYLTEDGYKRIRKSIAGDQVTIHTTSIVNCLSTLEPNSLTKVVLMDHMDWFNEAEAKEEIKMVHRTVAKGGQVFWRSSARKPWYNAIFQEVGFQVDPLAVREPGTKKPLDRVNMYASFYRATKL